MKTLAYCIFLLCLLLICDTAPQTTLFHFLGLNCSNVRLYDFDPGDAVKFREEFESKYGTRGQKLIELLGQGSSVTKLKTLTPESSSVNKKITTKNKDIKIKNSEEVKSDEETII